MESREYVVAALTLVGGLALFLFGMQEMTRGLSAAAGSGLKSWLSRTSKSRTMGFAAGTGAGVVMHSSAATVMLVSFVNAGLLSFSASIPIILGANVGTTLAMQVVSLKLGRFALSAIALGMLLKAVARRSSIQHSGVMLFGFGLLFLGMNTMSAAVVPLKEAGVFEPILAHTSASNVLGMGLGILAATLVTSLVQSSGATIGMCFALASAGVFTDLSSAFPLILGAHIGTCATALFGSIGTQIDARRAALTHLLFNVFGSILAVAMAPLYLGVIPMLGGDLTRQIANANTAVQIVGALFTLPLSAQLAALVCRLTPGHAPPEHGTFLDEAHLKTPEAAIAAVIQELARMTNIVRKMLRRAMQGFFLRTERPFGQVVRDEEAVDLIRHRVGHYLSEISRRKLSHRQAVLVQYLMGSSADIERMGDHVESLLGLIRRRHSQRVWFDTRSMEHLQRLFEQVDLIIEQTVSSLDPNHEDFDAHGRVLLGSRKAYKQLSDEVREFSNQRLMTSLDDPLTSSMFVQIVGRLDRIVRHSRQVARTLRQDMFLLKKHKLGVERGEHVFPEQREFDKHRANPKIFDTDFRLQLSPVETSAHLLSKKRYSK